MFVAPDPNIKVYTSPIISFDVSFQIITLKNKLRKIKIENIFKIKKPNL